MNLLTTLRQLNAARTKGPWVLLPSEPHWIFTSENTGLNVGSNNAAFIATAANAMSRLLRVVELAQSLMSEDGAKEALTHYNVLFLLMDALKDLEQE